MILALNNRRKIQLLFRINGTSAHTSLTGILLKHLMYPAGMDLGSGLDHGISVKCPLSGLKSLHEGFIPGTTQPDQAGMRF